MSGIIDFFIDKYKSTLLTNIYIYTDIDIDIRRSPDASRQNNILSIIIV